jgi:[acyl-carrier-protein] S-malonyltransferase
MFMSFAFVFPGQGSQSLKMMDNYLSSDIVQDTFTLAKSVLGTDFLSMLQEETPDNINQTINTQPLVLTAGYAMYREWIHKGGKLPQVMAGHSLGEWTALVASGAIDFKDALNLVRLRAQSMQAAVKPGDGAMAAVLGLDDEIIVAVCKSVELDTGGVVAGVNFNSPGQVVIAGSTDSVNRASELLKEKGARKVQPLPVSVPSHCSLMLPASIKLAEALKNVTFNPPQIPVLHNFNVEQYTDVAMIKEALVKQLYMPVLWTQTISKIANTGVLKIVESGPGKVLSGLNKRINPELTSYNLISDLATALTELN